jgi:hypothetical protein
MARLDGVSQEKASWIIRLLYWIIRRKTDRLADAWRITAYVPSLLVARGILEIILERSNLTDRRVRKLAELKTAMLIGCPS